MVSAMHKLERRLRPHPSSVGAGRRLVRQVLSDADRTDLIEAAELVVSELVTNALVHAGTDVDVVAEASRSGLRVEVSDESAHLPTTKLYSVMASTGRGLRLVDDLVDRWGAVPRPVGKTVWVELGHQAAVEASGVRAGADPAAAPAADGAAEVVLLNVPLLLHAAWQMHADSLLREYLLSQLDEGDAVQELERHAAASDAISVLKESIPEPVLADDPHEVMAGAVEPIVSRDRVTVPVPRSSVPHFEVLDQTLERALERADMGAFLSQPTQPEVRMLRRWLCTQVRNQAAGGGPVAWNSRPEDVEAPSRPLPGWDPGPVERAATPMLAADDTNRILTASPAAVELLGYRSVDDLAEHRLVDIIPVRYRQAHLAGFTLHLFTGRDPLIGTTVTVPALRQDGSEVEVELTVTARRLPDGRRLFLADLRRPSRTAG
jgi:PAS domain S-box-containing protein